MRTYQNSVRHLNGALMILLQQIVYTEDSIQKPIRVVSGSQEKILYDYLYHTSRDGGVEVALVLPAISVNLTGVERDETRKRQIKYYLNKEDLDGSQYTEVPIKTTFEVTIMSNTVHTTMEILEQLLVMFDPFYAVDIIHNENVKPVSTKFYMDSTDLDIQGEYGQNEKRVLTLNCNFTANGYILKPNTISEELIKEININVM